MKGFSSETNKACLWEYWEHPFPAFIRQDLSRFNNGNYEEVSKYVQRAKSYLKKS